MDAASKTLIGVSSESNVSKTAFLIAVESPLQCLCSYHCPPPHRTPTTTDHPAPSRS